MPAQNTFQTYGGVAKAFHWLTALLILTVIPLGIIANDLAHQIRAPGASPDGAMIARAALLFSLHKTVGVTIFCVAVARILWALSQPHPGLLNADNRLEALAAQTVHWLLYGSLVLVPLTGWIHHAAEPGFAPIWWPFGQGLPFVTANDGLAKLSATLHVIFERVLIVALFLHIAGAIKHHIIDRDATLRRMLPGKTAANPPLDQPGKTLPALAALGVWALALAVGAGLGLFQTGSHGTTAQHSETTLQEMDKGNWQVSDGTLAILVSQFGSSVEGQFTGWNASIDFDETVAAPETAGSVTVEIDISSLQLGSVTDQALGPDYFDVSQHPTATFAANIVATAEANAYLAEGTLTIKDHTAPLSIPVTISVSGTTATAKGRLTLDRRDFEIGASVGDEATLGFGVDVSFDLNATRP